MLSEQTDVSFSSIALPVMVLKEHRTMPWTLRRPPLSNVTASGVLQALGGPASEFSPSHYRCFTGASLEKAKTEIATITFLLTTLANMHVCVYGEGLHKHQSSLQMGAVPSKLYTLLESYKINFFQLCKLPSLFALIHSSISIIFDPLLISIVGAHFLWLENLKLHYISL